MASQRLLVSTTVYVSRRLLQQKKTRQENTRDRSFCLTSSPCLRITSLTGALICRIRALRVLLPFYTAVIQRSADESGRLELFRYLNDEPTSSRPPDISKRKNKIQLLSACQHTSTALDWLDHPTRQPRKQNEYQEPEYFIVTVIPCLLYTSPSPRDKRQSRMPSSA